MDLLKDTPIKRIEEDKLGRRPLVDILIDSINGLVTSDHPCMVYGIYGKWGEGKTSLLNFVKNRLRNQGYKDGIHLIVYNPWLVENNDALLREFFKSIMADSDDAIREGFRKYASLAIFASKTIVNAVVPGVGTALGNSIEWAKNTIGDNDDTIQKLKDKVSRQITKSQKHLVIIIDDVDRLDSEELHFLLRLIRQVADFPNCIYLLAMDVDMVSKSISKYHGNGSSYDGRKFIDKIVQVPITLPKIPEVKMNRLIRNELGKLLKGYLDEPPINDITKLISPLIETYRDLKRLCNQLLFVLPHLRGEVNVKDLCLLEAIKMVSNEAYTRIYNSKSALMHEYDSKVYFLDKNKEFENVKKRYEEAKLYITGDVPERLKSYINSIIVFLFDSDSYDSQVDIDKKRLCCDVYFDKYFTQMVPSNLIPDVNLDKFHSTLLNSQISYIIKTVNQWANNYSVSEVKRASLYAIRKFGNGIERCKAASIMSRALSLSSVAKDYSPYLDMNHYELTNFVAISLLSKYMFVNDEKTGDLRVRDEHILDDSLGEIFSNADFNFCINFLVSCNNLFIPRVYEGYKVLPILVNRYLSFGFEEQFRFSRLLLMTFYEYWQKCDRESFDKFVIRIFEDTGVDYVKVLDRVLSGSERDPNITNAFTKVFGNHVNVINRRILNDKDLSHQEILSVKRFKEIYKGLSNS